MTESPRQRTITISGKFGIDHDGDYYVDKTGSAYDRYFIEVEHLRTYPGVTVTVEDGKRALPTEQDSVIRATVNFQGEDYEGVILVLRDPGDQHPWLASSTGYAGDWVAEHEIGQDWVLLVEAQEG